MRIYFVQEKTADTWKPTGKRYLMPTFTSRHAAMNRIRHYAKTKEQRSQYRIIRMWA